MANHSNSHSTQQPGNESNRNAAARSTEVNSNPERSLEEARNANEGKTTNAAGSVAPSTAEEHVPSRSDPDASDLPSAR